MYKEFKKEGGQEKNLKRVAVINTPFIQEKSVTHRGDMLHTIDGPMQLIHADVADLNFFSKSAVAPKYCLLCVDLFSSKLYTYGMKKKKSQFAEKLEKFYSEIKNLRSYFNLREDIECVYKHIRNSIRTNKKKKNFQHNVEHYNSKLNEGHTVVAEQKIRELKNP